MKGDWLNVLKLLLKLGVSIACLYWVLNRIDITQMIVLVRNSDYLYFIPAFILLALSKIVSAFRLNGLLLQVGIKLNRKASLSLYWLGMFYNFFLPGGVGGDAYKSYILSRQYNKNLGRLVGTHVYDRLSGLLGLIYLAIIISYFINISVMLKCFIWLLIPISMQLNKVLTNKFFPTYSGVMSPALIQSFYVQFLQLLAVVFILLALGKYNSFPEYLFVFLLSSVAAALPISLGGAGSRELTFLLAAAYLRLDTEIAVTLSFCFYLLSLLLSLPGMYPALHFKTFRR